MPWTDLADIAKSPEGVTYLRILCNIDGPDVYFYIKNAGSTSLLYCLKFPNHLYEPSTKDLPCKRLGVRLYHSYFRQNPNLDLMAKASSLAQPLGETATDGNKSPTNNYPTTPAPIFVQNINDAWVSLFQY